MSARGMLTVVGTAVGGLIGWSDDEVPSADPASDAAALNPSACPRTPESGPTIGVTTGSALLTTTCFGEIN